MSTLDFAQLQALWTANGGPPIWADTMAAVAELESGGSTTAHNPSGATGLWQIEYPGSAGGRSQASLYDPNVNAQAAVQLLGGGPGIQNWGHDPAGHWNSGDAIGNYIQDHGDQPLNVAQLNAAGFGAYTHGGTSSSAGSSGASSGAALTGVHIPGTPFTIPNPFDIGGAVAGAGGKAIASGVLGAVDVIAAPLKKYLTDAFLVIFGAVLIIVGLVILAHAAGHEELVPSAPEQYTAKGQAKRASSSAQAGANRRQAARATQRQQRAAPAGGGHEGAGKAAGGSSEAAMEHEAVEAGELAAAG